MVARDKPRKNKGFKLNGLSIFKQHWDSTNDLISLLKKVPCIQGPQLFKGPNKYRKIRKADSPRTLNMWMHIIVQVARTSD